MRKRQRCNRTHATVLALYGLLAVGLTWPLVAHLGTHVPGSATWAFDEYTFLWNSWWLRYSLFDLNQNPLYSTHTFYPLGISLAFYTYNLFNALVSLPLQPFLSLPAISNLTFLGSTVLSGFGTFLLVRYLLLAIGDRRSTAGDDGTATAHWAAFLAGLIYAFGSYRMVYAAIGHYNLWSTQWIPFYTLFLLKTIREPGRRNALLAGVFMMLTLLCEMQLGVFLGLLTLFILLFTRRQEIAGGVTRLLGRLAMTIGTAALLYAPVLVPVLREMLGSDELPGWGDAQKLSVDLVGLFTPTALHPLGGDWTETLRQVREGTARFADVNTVFLGWAGVCLALLGLIAYRRRVVAWTASAVTFAVLSLGPLLQINGRSVFDLDGLEVNVPLPFIVLHYLPIIKANRVPNRFSVVLMLCLAVLVGFGAYRLLGWAAGRRAQANGFGPVPAPGRRSLRLAAGGLLLSAFVLFDHWSVPLPLTDARIPPVYAQVAAEPDDFAILQLPLGWRNSFGVLGAESTQTQYYQTYHHKRLLSGNISRNPSFKFDYFRQVPILDSLITLETYGEVDEARRTADRATAAEFLRFYDIRYVVVAQGIPGRPPYADTRDEAVAYLEDVLPLEKTYDQDGWLLYRVDPSVPSTTVGVDLGSEEPLVPMVLGEGWAPAEEIQGARANWATAQSARLFLPAAGGDYRLTLRALPFDYPGAEGQQIAVSVNGRLLPDQVRLQPGWGDYAWEIPADLVRQGPNDVRLAFAWLAAPADVLPDNGAIGTTGIRTPIAIEANSGGLTGFAYITLGEGERAGDGSMHSPGYNVAVVDPKNGRLLGRQGFDTTPTGSLAQAEALADYLRAVPAGQIVVVALQGDGTAYLTETAVAAFRAIGGQVDPRGSPGGSHALIGAQGATPGSALEVSGDAGWLRVAPDRRTLAVAVDAVRWEQVGE